MRRFVSAMLLIALIAAGMGLGYRIGRTERPLPDWTPPLLAEVLGVRREAQKPAPTGPVIYYQDPDSKPFYSVGQKKTGNGRDFVPVRASEDVSFGDKPAEKAAFADSGAESGKRVIYYRNPMGLPDTSPLPKKDSMGMEYIPVYEGEAEDGATVKISPGKLQRTGVRSEIVERRVVTRPVRVPGSVQLDERRVAVVATRSDAFIDKVENVTTGDRVRKGQPLLFVYSPEINAAAAQLVAAPGFEGSRRRLRNLNVSDDAIAEIERTRTVPLAIQWSAPRDGLVLERNAIDGMRAAPGETLFRIADVSSVWVVADVPEYDLGAVRVGQAVTIRVRALPGRTYPGKVGLIYPQVNKETRTTRIRVELSNPDGTLLPDMYADVAVVTGGTKPVVAVPDDAVIDTGARQVVLIDKSEGRFEPREVKIGTRGGGFTEIREGVQAGEQVVTSANFLIDAESNLKAALQSMVAATPAEPQSEAKEKQP